MIQPTKGTIMRHHTIRRAALVLTTAALAGGLALGTGTAAQASSGSHGKSISQSNGYHHDGWWNNDWYDDDYYGGGLLGGLLGGIFGGGNYHR